MYEIVCELCVIFKLKIVYYALLGNLKLNMTQKIYSKYVHNIQMCCKGWVDIANFWRTCYHNKALWCLYEDVFPWKWRGGSSIRTSRLLFQGQSPEKEHQWGGNVSNEKRFTSA